MGSNASLSSAISVEMHLLPLPTGPDEGFDKSEVDGWSSTRRYVSSSFSFLIDVVSVETNVLVMSIRSGNIFLLSLSAWMFEIPGMRNTCRSSWCLLRISWIRIATSFRYPDAIPLDLLTYFIAVMLSEKIRMVELSNLLVCSCRAKKIVSSYLELIGSVYFSWLQ